MKIEGSYTLSAPQNAVWEALNNPEMLSKTIPGGQELEKTGENQYRAKMKIKVGPVQGVFDGNMELTDIKPPNSYHLIANGRGAPGFVKGEGNIRLEAQGDKTILYYEGNAEVGGRLASVGQRLMDTSAQALIRQSLETLEAEIQVLQQNQNSKELLAEVATLSKFQLPSGMTHSYIDPLGKKTRIGDYELIEELGRGGFAAVYRARHVHQGRQVALKVIAGSFANDPEFVERFKQEAATAANLHHPNIITVYDFGRTTDDMLYLTMRLVEGPTLKAYLGQRGSLPLSEALAILEQIAQALDYLHGRNHIHRDVKPANVLLEGTSSPFDVTLTDFGLVRSLESSVQITQTIGVLGTAAYMAPEQTAPKRRAEIGPPTDAYALAVVAYELVTGHLPFEGDLLTVINAHANHQPPSPLTFVPELGDDLAAVILQGLAKEPAGRFSGAGQFVDALQTVVKGRETVIRQAAKLEQLLDQAQSAHQASNWLRLQDLSLQIVREHDRAHPQALEWMAEAVAAMQQESAEEIIRRKRAQRYEEGIIAQEKGDWLEAIAAFEEVAKGNPDFRDVQFRLAIVIDEQRRAEWFDQAIAFGEIKNWFQACLRWLQVLENRADYRDGEAVIRFLEATTAMIKEYRKLDQQLQNQYESLDRFQKALSDYDRLALAVQQTDWSEVIALSEKLLAADLKLNQPAQWLKEAKIALEQELQQEKETLALIDPITKKYIGILKWYNEDGEYGLISRGGEDIFFHKSYAIGYPNEWNEGQSVLYNVEEVEQGLEATEVEPYTSVVWQIES